MHSNNGNTPTPAMRARAHTHMHPPHTRTRAQANFLSVSLTHSVALLNSLAMPRRRNHALITLLPNADRSPMPEMANLGTQLLAVVGGQLSWYGMPGGNSTPSWVRLARTALAGQSRILVDGDVSAWPLGATVSP